MAAMTAAFSPDLRRHPASYSGNILGIVAAMSGVMTCRNGISVISGNQWRWPYASYGGVTVTCL